MFSITALDNIPQGVPPQNSTLPIDRETITKEPQERAERPNKYKYDEFAGYSGERYLDTILQKIIPYALWRTWHYAVEFQAPGLPCYVGTARLAERVKPQQRKIEMDLQEFRERGLVRIYADRLPIVGQDGTIRYQAVTIKDWTPLYDLAHEYHIWTLNPSYIPAERQYIDLLVAEPELLQKLLKFDNYRRAVLNKKPGRKPAYQCTLPTEQAANATAAPVATPRTEVPNPKYYINSFVNTSSPYRISSNSQNLTSDDTNSNFQKEEVFGVAPKTIRRGEEDISELVRKTTEEEETESSKSNSEPSPTVQEMPAENAEEAEEYNIDELKKKPLALAAALADMVQREKQKQQQQTQATKERQKPKQQERPRRFVPDWFIRLVTQQAQELGDDPKVLKSVLTRLSKTVLTAEQVFGNVSEIEVTNRLDEARKRTGKHASKVMKRRANGQKNYMPYFIECFTSLWGFREEELAFIASDEPLYQDGNISDFVERLIHQYERSGSQLEFSEWVKQRREQAKQQKRKK
jgi:hypothetical protein